MPKIEGEVDVNLTFKGHQVEIPDVPFSGTYRYDPGCRTMSNGDPGWPETLDLEVETTWSPSEVLKAVEQSYIDFREVVPSVFKQELGKLVDAVNTRIHDVVYENMDNFVEE